MRDCHIHHQRLVWEGDVEVGSEPLGSVYPRLNVDHCPNLTKELGESPDYEVMAGCDGRALLEAARMEVR
jgi:hypothetical protein